MQYDIFRHSLCHLIRKLTIEVSHSKLNISFGQYLVGCVIQKRLLEWVDLKYLVCHFLFSRLLDFHLIGFPINFFRILLPVYIYLLLFFYSYNRVTESFIMIISLYECFGFFYVTTDVVMKLLYIFCSNDGRIHYQTTGQKKNLEKRQNLWKKRAKNKYQGHFIALFLHTYYIKYKEYETIYKYSYTGIPRRKENDYITCIFTKFLNIFQGKIMSFIRPNK